MYIKVNKFKKKNNKKILGIIYGKNFKNKKIEFEKKNIYYEKLKKNKIIKLKLINNIFSVIIKEIKIHNYKNEIEHIDFFLKNEE
ncbi:hypothetical protein NDNC_0370 [Candidatus Nasuia deltocephalinicola]|uniref:50S ribosomal protein L25 n=1 Tax=Candidatus Nasuia deltocephalincola TaxID=1160784 RepID=A0A974WL56_9PROT|nr:hypothetical protein CU086_00660 [Candidatus Nasuia deltocephalinicola]BEH03871.1 hypothetical protein NDNC_0370 [Candidatus Nasuia deltocephalinicola]